MSAVGLLSGLVGFVSFWVSLAVVAITLGMSIIHVGERDQEGTADNNSGSKVGLPKVTLVLGYCAAGIVFLVGAYLKEHNWPAGSPPTIAATPAASEAPTAIAPEFDAEIYNRWLGYFPLRAGDPPLALNDTYYPPRFGENTLVFVFVEIRNLNSVPGTADLWKLRISVNGILHTAVTVHGGRFTINSDDYNNQAGVTWDEDSEAIYNTANRFRPLTNQWVKGYYAGIFDVPSKEFLDNLGSLQLRASDADGGSIYTSVGSALGRTRTRLKFVRRAAQDVPLEPLP